MTILFAKLGIHFPSELWIETKTNADYSRATCPFVSKCYVKILCASGLINY